MPDNETTPGKPKDVFENAMKGATEAAERGQQSAKHVTDVVKDEALHILDGVHAQASIAGQKVHEIQHQLTDKLTHDTQGVRRAMEDAKVAVVRAKDEGSTLLHGALDAVEVDGTGKLHITHDPVLFGVSLPLRITLRAATKIRSAWVQAGVEVFQAIKAKGGGKAKGRKSKTGGTSVASHAQKGAAESTG